MKLETILVFSFLMGFIFGPTHTNTIHAGGTDTLKPADTTASTGYIRNPDSLYDRYVIHQSPPPPFLCVSLFTIGGDTSSKWGIPSMVWNTKDTAVGLAIDIRNPLPRRIHDNARVYADVFVRIDGEIYTFTFEQFSAMVRRMKNYRLK